MDNPDNSIYEYDSDAEEGSLEESLMLRGVYRPIPPRLWWNRVINMPEWNFSLPDIESLDDLEYLAEGNANVIFALNMDLEGQPRRVIRLQKDSRRLLDPMENMRYFSNEVRCMFSDNQVIDQGILPTDAETLEAFNELVTKAEQEGRRPANRRGSRLSTDRDWVFIMTDMRPQTPNQSMVEFKPKWLLQSPSAPQNAIRCRNCALREMRASDKRKNGGVESASSRAKIFCPFNLLSDDLGTLRSIARAVGAPTDKIDLFATGMLNNATIARLRKAQFMNSDVHQCDFQFRHDEVGLGMTIRDCTLFMRVDEAMSPPKWECVLADLDMKICDDENHAKWAGVETRLIEEGWYQGTEVDDQSNKAACNLELGRKPIIKTPDSSDDDMND